MQAFTTESHNMSKQQTIPVTVRVRKDGTPELFFVNENPRGWWLEGYAHIGQHLTSCREYMLSCRLQRPGSLSDEALALVREWDSNGPADDYKARIVSRLTYPKGKPYIGK